jgi:hypothetical protein
MTPTDAQARYELAHELELRLAEVWRATGQPTTLVNDRGTEVIHPLLKALQQAARDADRFRSALERRPIGRPLASSSAADRHPIKSTQRSERPAPLRRIDNKITDPQEGTTGR